MGPQAGDMGPQGGDMGLQGGAMGPGEVTWALKEVTWGFGWSFLAQGGHFRHPRNPISASREITWGP